MPATCAIGQDPDRLALLVPQRGPQRAEIHQRYHVAGEPGDPAGELVLAGRGVGLEGLHPLAEGVQLAGAERGGEEELVARIGERHAAAVQLDHVAELAEAAG